MHVRELEFRTERQAREGAWVRKHGIAVGCCVWHCPRRRRHRAAVVEGPRINTLLSTHC